MTTLPTRSVITTRDGERVFDETSGRGIRLSLLAYLATATIESRALLVEQTQNAASFVDPQGVLCVGPWRLAVLNGNAVLRYRQPPTAVGMIAFIAELTEDRGSPGGWRVDHVGIERIARRI